MLLSLFFNSKLYSLYKQCNDEVHNHNGIRMENIVFWLLHFGSFFPYTGAATPLEELKKNLDAFEVNCPAIVSIVFSDISSLLLLLIAAI